jgi:hypothetical protein
MLTPPDTPAPSAGVVLVDQRLAMAPHVCEHIRFGDCGCEGMDEIGPVGLIANAMNLVRLIETVVLHEGVVLRCDDFMADALENDPVIKPWLDAGVATLFTTNPLEPLIKSYLDGEIGSVQWTNACNIQELLFSNALQTSLVPSLDGGWSLTRRTLVDWAAHADDATADKKRSKARRKRSNEVTAEVLLQCAATAGAAATAEGARESLLTSYADFSHHARERFDRLAALGRPTPIFIPPIAAIVLSRVRTLEALGTAALDLRAELEPFRRRFTEYDSVIRNPEATLEEAEAAANRLTAGVDAILRTDQKFDLVAIADWREALALFKVWLDGLAASDTPSLAKVLLGQPLKWLQQRLRRRDVMYLAYLADRFAKIESHAAILERLFQVKFTDRYFRIADDYMNRGVAPSIALMYHLECFWKNDRRGRKKRYSTSVDFHRCGPTSR